MGCVEERKGVSGGEGMDGSWRGGVGEGRVCGFRVVSCYQAGCRAKRGG